MTTRQGKKPRKAITPALKVAALLHRVFLQFGVYLACPLSGEPMKPGDRIQFDHIHAVGLDGPNVYDNLRPVLVSPHQKKTKGDLRMIKKARSGHADKFIVVKSYPERANGGYARAMDLTSERRVEIAKKAATTRWATRSWPSRKMQSRKFGKRETA
jgi:hypothetical protein